VLALVDHGEIDVQTAAIEVLGELATKNDTAVVSLLQKTRSSNDSGLRWAAEQALSEMRLW